MMTRFNLASHPYENLRPRYLLAAMALVLAVVLAGILITRERQQDAETRSITQQMARFNQEMDNLAQQRRELDEWLRRPEVQEIREHSAFLNSLIARKSLSWTQMFLDLEEILPHNAQVTAIQPRVNRSQQQPELSLLVLSDSMGPLVELLKNLESSSRFGSPAVLSQRFSEDKEDSKTQVRMELRTFYRQMLPELPAPEPGPEQDASQPEALSDDTTDLARREGGL